METITTAVTSSVSHPVTYQSIARALFAVNSCDKTSIGVNSLLDPKIGKRRLSHRKTDSHFANSNRCITPPVIKPPTLSVVDCSLVMVRAAFLGLRDTDRRHHVGHTG